MHKFKIGKYQGLNMPYGLNYTEADLTAAANQAIISLATEWLKTNGVIEIGDTITVVNQATLDGVIVPELTSSTLTYMVGDKSILAPLNEAAGKKQGDIFEIAVTFPEGSPIQRVQNKEVVFQIEIKDVKHGGTQAVTDDLIRQVAPQYNNLGEIQNFYKAMIADAAKETAADQLIKKIIDAIVNDSEYELDQTVYDQAVETLKKQEQSLSKAYDIQKGFDPENNLKKFYAQCQEQAKYNILADLVCKEVAKLENIQITEDELQGNKEAFSQTPEEEAQFKQFFPTDDDFKQFLLTEKTKAQLIELNKAK